MPSRHWDDLWQEQHARGFMVAGAMKADLLTDLKDAVDRAISEGETITDFRERFNEIVKRHGWTFKGGRNWRTNVIYSTNLRTAYMAGRYKQMKDPEVVKLRPYWQYRHGDSRQPRPEHLAWDGLILEHDHPWWDTHYTPNGWGCKCRVVTLSARDLARLGKSGPDKAPVVRYRQWEDRSGQPHQVPAGIDPGWDYNVGQAAGQPYKVLAGKFNAMDNKIAKKWIASLVSGPTFERFWLGKIDEDFPVAVLSPGFHEAIGAEVQTVFMSGETLLKNKKHHPDLDFAEYQLLPDIIESAQLVIRDGELTEVFIRRDGRIYHAAVKATKTGKALFLTSFRRTDGGDAERVRRKPGVKVLKDEL